MAFEIKGVVRLFSAGLLFALASCTAGTWRITAENDSLSRDVTDRNYTNGTSISYSPNRETTYEIGQKIYTPQDLTQSARIPDDRPYAGQLWVGATKHKVATCKDGCSLTESTGVRVGVVGALSLASETQRFVHNDVGIGVDPKGWRHQIEDELTVGVHFERRRQLFGFGSARWGGDVIGLARADLGTDITRFRAGAILRFGLNLPSASERPSMAPLLLGPSPIGPRVPFGSASDSRTSSGEVSACECAKRREPLRAYLSLQADAHATAYNIFIDNHLFRRGTDLSLEPLGYDLSASLMFEWDGYRIGYQQIFRSAEFEGDDRHAVGSIVVGWSIGGR